ncbi:MAG: hypothetical protein GY795_49240 [Desulfobacterales bacterium]|nr:hypothetical protein [Desulfobacterales bacterium]
MAIDIPAELISSLNNGKLVLFIGHNLDLSESKLPSISSLTGELAEQTKAWTNCPVPVCHSKKQCTFPGECALSFHRVATICEQVLGRNHLIRFLKDNLTENIRPTSIFKAITQLPIQTVFTMAYDERLENAYRATGIRYQTIANDSQIVTDESTQVQIVHLYGVLSQPESLILTEADYASLSLKKQLTEILIKSYLATRVCLFVATNFNDHYLQTIYSITVERLGPLRRWPYVIDFHPKSSSTVKVHSLQESPYEFLVALKDKLEYRRLEIPPPPEPETPYKFLDYFEDKDRAIFVGRDSEINELKSRVMSHRMTILYAFSGMGKTSLLQAGVIPHLKFEGFKVENVRLYPDPQETLQIMMQCITKYNHSASSFSDSSSTGQVFIIDQTEELFTTYTLEDRRVYVKTLLSYLDNDQLDIRVLLSLRIEYLGQLEDLFSSQGRSDILSNRFRLGALGPEQTRLAILKPAKMFEIDFENPLIDAMLTYLETGGFDPTQLQIICYQLYQDIVSNKVDTRKLTFARYEELGGPYGIIGGFLDDALARIGVDKVQTDAKVILKNMVTIERTKMALMPEEIVKRVAYASLSKADVHNLLKLLQTQRIVRCLEDGRYELTHDVLVSKIWTWMSETDNARLNALQTLQEAMSQYREHNHLMSTDKQIAVEQGAGSFKLKADELALLLMSAINTNDRKRARIWIRQINEHADKLEVVVNCQSLGTNPTKLLQILTKYFNEKELRDICLNLNIDYDNLPDRDKSKGLIAYVMQHHRFFEFVKMIQQLRPEYSWDVWPETKTENPLAADELYRILDEGFGMGDLRTLCFYLHLDYNSLPEKGKKDKARELIIYFNQQNRITDLIRMARQFNPYQFKKHWLETTKEPSSSLQNTFPEHLAEVFKVLQDAQYSQISQVRDSALRAEILIYPDLLPSLYKKICESFDLSKFKDLCLSLDVDFDQIAGDVLNDKVRELIIKYFNSDQLDNLIAIVRYHCPHIMEKYDIKQPPNEATLLLELLGKKFDLEALSMLSNYLIGIDVEQLSYGERMIDKARELVSMMRTRGQLDYLRLAIERFQLDELHTTHELELELEKALLERFDIEQIRTLCFDLGINYWNIDNSDKQRMVKCFIELMADQHRLSELIDGTIFPDRAGSDRFEAVMRRRLCDRLNSKKLTAIVVYLGVETDIWGSNLIAKIRELISHMRRHDRLGELIFQIMRNWPDVLPKDEIWERISSVIEYRGQTLNLFHEIFDLNWQDENLTFSEMLCSIIEQRYGDGDFQILCMDLDIDYDNLKGETPMDKHLEFVSYLETSDRLKELVFHILDDRPDLVELINNHPGLADFIKESKNDESD